MTRPVLSPKEISKGKRFFKSIEQIHLRGIRAPEIRRISKELFSLVKPYWTQEPNHYPEELG